jgi:hypothetical protein
VAQRAQRAAPAAHNQSALFATAAAARETQPFAPLGIHIRSFVFDLRRQAAPAVIRTAMSKKVSSMEMSGS